MEAQLPNETVNQQNVPVPSPSPDPQDKAKWQVWVDKILYTNIGVASLYLTIITIIEVFTAWYSPIFGLVACSVLLIATLVHTTVTWGNPLYKLLVAISFAPLIRLVSLSIPLGPLDQIYWYLLTGIPLSISGYFTMNLMQYNFRDIAMTWGKFRIQILIASTGILFGFVEYSILEPQPIVRANSLLDLVIPAIILMIGTGFFEEFIFRGVMQRAAIDAAGDIYGLFFVAAVFAVLHFGYKSIADIIFVFCAGLIWGIATYRTNSIFGVTLAHGITNIILLLLLPYYATGGG